MSGSLSGGPASLRRVHRALALRALAQQPGIGRTELAEQLGLSFMAVGRIVRELEHAGLASDLPTRASASGRGRPAAGLKLRADGAYVAGAVISAFAREVHLFNLSGESVASIDVPIAEITDGPRAVTIACKAIKQLIRQSQIPGERVVGAGFSVAANVNSNLGAVVGGGYLDWAPFDLSALASQMLAVPVTVNNMGDALLRAEVFAGCAQDAAGTVLIHASTTLSASHLTGDHLVNGAQSKAGRIGHYPIAPTNRVCSCGQTDCLNCVASGWSVLCQLHDGASTAYQFEHIQHYSDQTRALVAGAVTDRQRANRLVFNAGKSLTPALRYLDLANDPQRIVLSGPLAGLDSYINGLNQGLKDAGPHGEEVLRKLVRGAITPGQASGITALLDTVFAPALELQRLAERSAGTSKQVQQ